MKFIPFLIVGLGNVVIGIVLFFLLIVSLNGFSGKQAEPGLILFIIWVLVNALLTAFLSIATTNYFSTKKSLNFWLATLISILVFLTVGAAINFVGLIAAVILVDAMR